MNIGGIIKSSLIDFPGKISCVVFTQGCNFHCPYCHNPDLVPMKGVDHGVYSVDSLYAFLETRKGLLDGVVISGGEPTLQKGLVERLRQIKGMGFQVKLDTNGSNPQVLRVLLSENLVDYIAMDVKTDPYRYAPGLWLKNDPNTLLASISVIMNQAHSYEFRTTCVRPFVDKDTLRTIATSISGAKRFVLQPFKPSRTLDPGFSTAENPGFSEKTLQEFKGIADPFVQECVIR